MSLDPNFFCQYAPCDNQNLLAELVAMASIQQFKKREIILEMGTQQKWFYLLKQGVTCSYSLQSDGSEITDCIMAEPGMPVMPSPELDIPSPTYIEALTDCTLVLLKISDVQNIAQYNPGLATLINRYLSRAWHDHYKTESALRLLPARDRYKWFLDLDWQLHPNTSHIHPHMCG